MVEQNRKLKRQKTNGITLIALVITIIVLLILAGVSIAMLTGENGILTQAQKAKNETENAARQEEMDLAELEAAITGKDVTIVQVDDKNPGQLEQENDNTFVINSIEDLVFFSNDVTNGNTYEGQTVKLGTNLDFSSDKSYVDPNRTDFAQYGYSGPLKQALISGTGFTPIGELTPTGTKHFYGTFDGNNNAICSLYINIDIDENIRTGLFSTCYGEIRNLGLVDTDITTKGNGTTVGGITGASYDNVYNSYVTGNINVTGSSWMPVGGLCGVLHGSANIENCYNLANISATNIQEDVGVANISCGGIVGQIEDEKININKCYNKGDITADGGNNYIRIGGIYGAISSTVNSGSIKNCYNNAKIEGRSKATETTTFIGGIAGDIRLINISNCYNVGEIIGDARNLRIGGIIGSYFKNITINNLFNLGKITVKNSDIFLVGGGIISGTYGGININIENTYNTGKIELINSNITTKDVGSIIGNSDSATLNNCYYLKGTYDVGVGESGSSTGIQEIDSIEDFPSVLDVVNGEGAFKEDTNNINNGYPILEWQ